MVNNPKQLLHTAMFLFLILCSIVLNPDTPKTFAADYDVLVAELRKDDWQTRLNKSGAINLDDEKMFNALIDLINNGGLDWKIRIRGIHMLGESRNPMTADILIRTLQNSFITDECPAIKSSLAFELGKFHDDTRVLDALVAGLDDEELQVKEASIRSLGMIGDTKAVPFLLDRLKDKNFTVRLNAIRSIGRIGDRKAIPYLREIIDSDGDVYIRNEASAALARME